MLETRYRALRIVSVLYKIAAVLAFILTILGVIAIFALNSRLGLSSSYYYSSNTTLSQLIFAGIELIGGTLFSITLYAAANMIDLFVAMEENTRVTAMLLQRMASTQPMMGVAPQMQMPQQPVWPSQVPGQPQQQYSGWGAQQPPQPPQQR